MTILILLAALGLVVAVVAALVSVARDGYSARPDDMRNSTLYPSGPGI